MERPPEYGQQQSEPTLKCPYRGTMLLMKTWRETMRPIPIRPEQYEPQWLHSLPLRTFADLQESEARFLNGIIRATKPKRLLEVGVLHGGSSMIMLNAIKDDSAAHLYSVDYAETVPWGWATGRKIGWAVHECTPELVTQWSLSTGGHVAEFIDNISTEGGGRSLLLGCRAPATRRAFGFSHRATLYAKIGHHYSARHRLGSHYSKKNVDMFLRNYELNKWRGVDGTPIAPPVISPVPEIAPYFGTEPIIRRIAKLRKRTLVALACSMGFLSRCYSGMCFCAEAVMHKCPLFGSF